MNKMQSGIVYSASGNYSIKAYKNLLLKRFLKQTVYELHWHINCRGTTFKVHFCSIMIYDYFCFRTH